MSTILKKRAFISFIYFKTIIIDISISFGNGEDHFLGIPSQQPTSAYREKSILCPVRLVGS
jgi:hypothetical protein